MLREQHIGFVPFFFFYAADVGLFLETGKGLTCAVLRKVLTSGRIDKYGITFWKAPQNSCLGPQRMVFVCPRARAYGVRDEAELFSLCQRGVSEDVQPSFRFIKPCSCFRVGSSVLAGKRTGTTFKLKMD